MRHSDAVATCVRTLVLALAICVIGGCGDSGSQGAASFATQTDEVCSRFQDRFSARIAELAQEYQARGLTAEDINAETPLARRLGDDIRKLLPALRGLIRDLRTVPPPDGQAEDVSYVIDEMKRVVERYARQPLLATDPTSTYSIDEADASAGIELCPGL